jgi:3',5'-cyclic AMP phosphodiesterase CpdA
MNRRDVLLASFGTAALGTISTVRAAETAKPVLKAAHITDVHITHDRESPAGVAAMFKHMLGQKTGAPEVILNTGDTVMAVDGKVSGKRAAQQIELWKTAIQNVKIPIRSCLGNHDVWDGFEPTDAIPETKKRFTLMKEVMSLPATYYSFDLAGWHFIALNSVEMWPKYGEVGAEQFQWLINDLKKTPKETPVCVLSHLPIVSVTSSLYGDGQKKDDGVLIPKVWQHRDCWEISEVFRRFPNVKLCLSGHMHTQDRCEYRGVWYICGGAASGAWWSGSEYGFAPCYGSLDFYANGSFEYRFVDYDWKARGWKGKELKLGM